MISFCYLGFLAASFIAALSDLLFYRIPNALIATILAGVGFKLFLEHPNTDYYLTALIFLITLLSGYLLYAFRIMGAGDAKFLSASILWLMPQDVPSYLVIISISGGILSIFYIFWHSYIDSLRINLIERMKGSCIFNQDWMFKTSLQSSFTYANTDSVWSKTLVPYGVSIFTGSVILVSLYLGQRGFQ